VIFSSVSKNKGQASEIILDEAGSFPFSRHSLKYYELDFDRYRQPHGRYALEGASKGGDPAGKA